MFAFAVVAMGRLDMYYEGLSPKSGPKPWDFGAAMLILSEAGGVMCDHNGDEFDMTSGRIICASSTQLLKQGVAIFKA